MNAKSTSLWTFIIATVVVVIYFIYSTYSTNRIIAQLEDPNEYTKLTNGATIIDSFIRTGYRRRGSYREAIIQYEYTVNNQKYKSDSISPNTADPQIVDKYPRGATVDVFYNIKDPSVSYLEKGSRVSWLSTICMLFLVGAILGAKYYFENKL